MHPIPTAFAAALLMGCPSYAATVGVPEKLEPWSFDGSRPTGEQGVYADLTVAMAARTDIPIVIRFVPSGHLLQAVKSGEVDYAFDVVSPGTSAAAPFVTIVGKVPMIAVARKGLVLKTVSDLRSFAETGYIRGGTCGAAIDGDPAINRVSQDSYVAAIRKLAVGRLDGWCSIAAGFAYTLAAMKMADKIGDQLQYGEIQIGFQVTSGKRGSPEANALGAVLDGLVKDGAAGTIFAHYLGAPYPP